MKKICSLVLVAAFMFATIPYQTFALEDISIDNTSRSLRDSRAYTFNISIYDEDGNPVDNATVSLYSYLDSEVVKNATSEESGACTLFYVPSFDAKHLDQKSLLKGSSQEVVYGDYIVYVAKDGYESELYYLTKGYSPADDNGYDQVNREEIIITLHPASSVRMSAQSLDKTDASAVYQKEVYDYCVEAGKISDENPIYILQPEDKAELSKQGVVNPAEYASMSACTVHTGSEAMSMLGTSSAMNPSVYAAVIANHRNKLIPIGQFHVGPGAQVDVTFNSSNKVKVQSSVDGKVSGSITRTLGFTTTYAPFTATSAKKQTYFTKGHFVEEETLHTGGYIRNTIRLDQLIGGAATGVVSSCSTCGKSYRNLTSSQDGTILSLPKGASQAQYQDTTVDTGLTVAVGPVNLGVTHTIASGVQVKYTAVSKNIWLYDKNFTGKVWHVTSE